MSEFLDPIARNEAILQNMLGAHNELLPPMSRIETLLLMLLEQWENIGRNGKTYDVVIDTSDPRFPVVVYHSDIQNADLINSFNEWIEDQSGFMPYSFNICVTDGSACLIYDAFDVFCESDECVVHAKAAIESEYVAQDDTILEMVISEENINITFSGD